MMDLNRVKFSTKCAALAASLFLGACEEAQKVPELPTRAVKTIELEPFAGEQTRRLAGVVEAQEISELAFQVSGRVVDLAYDIGETVSAGEIVARLDKQPYELRIKAAEATLAQAQARRRDAQAKFTQQSELFQNGFASKTALDTAQANMETSASSVTAAQAELDLAKRDLDQAELRAPFQGSIGERYIDQFSEVSSGQRIYQLNSDGRNEVRLNLPENLTQNISLGDAADVEFPTIEGLSITGRVTEIGSRTNAANAYQMTIALDQQSEVLKPGMTAEVTFSFDSGATQTAFLLPIGAVVAQPIEGTGKVYVFKEDQGVVEQREVAIINVIGNDLEVVGPIEAGEKVVAAGVVFLNDGMKVRAMSGKVR